METRPRKKILSIVPYKFVPANTGGQRHAYGFLSHLSEFAELYCFSVQGNQELPKNAGFSLNNAFQDIKSKYFSLSLYFLLGKAVKNHQAEGLLIEQPFMGLLAWLVARMSGIKFYVHSHNIESDRFKSLKKIWWPLLFIYEKWVLRRADLVFFISKEDKAMAVRRYGLKEAKAVVSPYGVPMNAPPPALPEETVKFIRKKHEVEDDEKLILFFGVLDYEPNKQALRKILNDINPRLYYAEGFYYKILICGKGLPASFKKLDGYEKKNVIYVGFVDSIEEYIQAADMIICPVTSGGGVKTKIVEALAYNKPVVAFESGVHGVNSRLCGQSLTIIKDHDYLAFANHVIHKDSYGTMIPQDFYERYAWKKIAEDAAKLL